MNTIRFQSNDRVFATQLDDDATDRAKKAAEEKELEDSKRFKEAFERIRKIVGPEAGLDKIVADFIKVEDQNFALFNYVTEMNNQVRQQTIVIDRNELMLFIS